MFKLAIALTLALGANAACPNSCSGHGTCGDNEVCSCHDNFGMGGLPGGDCSDRMCPYELAWVDAPEKDGSTHNYAECAAKGICDRSSGLCECFDGYEGKACSRQVCEKDCSGHGTCEYMNELSFGTVFNDYYDGTAPTTNGALGVGAVRPSADASWDAKHARTCVCDAGWSGLSCADRMCPVGNDILDTRMDMTSSNPLQYQVQRIELISGGVDGKGNNTNRTNETAPFHDKTFALKFTSKLNESFITRPIKYLNHQPEHDFAYAIGSALMELPNQIVNGVQVTATSHFRYGIASMPLKRGITIQVTFTGTSVEGNQNLLEVMAAPCSSPGCAPLTTGIADGILTADTVSSFIYQEYSADYNSFECGRRGKCDVDTGICNCFEGYTSDACTIMSSLT